MSVFDNFAQGMDPSATRLILGDFEFVDFEIPERIAIGAKQQTVKHKYVGGLRTIDVLGVDWDDLQWSGIINGPESAARVQALERMRDAGEQLTFTLGDYSFEVVVAEFVPVYEFVFRRPYSIKLEIVQRNDTPAKVDALTGSLDALINSDVGQSLNLSSVINVQAVTDAVTAVQTAVQQVQDFANATVSAVQSVVRPIVAAQQMVQKTIAQLEASANTITTLGGLVSGNPVAKTVNNLLTQVDLSTRTPALYQLSDVLGRLNKNVQAGQSANGVRTVTLSGGNLYQAASQQYGDSSRWTSLATANGLTDPQLSGIQTIVVPDKPS
jgi:hypothetical protein